MKAIALAILTFGLVFQAAAFGESTLTFAYLMDEAEMADVGIAIVNPGSQDAGTTFTLYGSEGQVIETSKVVIPAGGQVMRSAAQLISSGAPVVASAAVSNFRVAPSLSSVPAFDLSPGITFDPPQTGAKP